MRATVPRLDSITSIKPGPWWLKPLWSLRQQVDVSRMFSEAIGARQASLVPSSSHFVCCTAFEAALAKVLAQHFHHTAVGRDMVVDVDCFSDEATVFDLEHAAQPVRVGL